MKLLLQIALASVGGVAGLMFGLNSYLDSVGARPQDRERLVGVVLIQTAAPTALGISAGVLVGGLLLRSRDGDRRAAKRYVEAKLTKGLSPADSEVWLQTLALMQSEES